MAEWDIQNGHLPRNVTTIRHDETNLVVTRYMEPTTSNQRPPGQQKEMAVRGHKKDVSGGYPIQYQGQQALDNKGVSRQYRQNVFTQQVLLTLLNYSATLTNL